MLEKAGFKVVWSSGDPEADGEAVTCRFDYDREEPLDWDEAVELINQARHVAEARGDKINLSVVRGTR